MLRIQFEIITKQVQNIVICRGKLSSENYRLKLLFKHFRVNDFKNDISSLIELTIDKCLWETFRDIDRNIAVSKQM